MEPQTRRTTLAIVICVLILIGWTRIMSYLYPPPTPTTASAPVERGEPEFARDKAEDEPTPTSHSADGPSVATGPSAGPSITASRATGLHATGGNESASVRLGDDRHDSKDFTNPYKFAVTTTSEGAAVATVGLADHRLNVPKDRKNPENDPYPLLKPVEAPGSGSVQCSFATDRILVDGKEVALGDLNWRLVDQNTEAETQHATYEAVVRDGEDELLRIRKMYRVRPSSPHIELRLSVENVSRGPHTVAVDQYGPMGIHKEELRAEDRRVVAAVMDDQGRINIGDHPLRMEVFKAKEDDREHVKTLRPGENRRIAWAGLGNKYFGVIMAPVDPQTDKIDPSPIARAEALSLFDDKDAVDDLTFRLDLKPNQPLAAGKSVDFAFEIYCGDKSSRRLHEIDPERNYYVMTVADRSWCNIEILSTAMHWLLDRLYGIFHNYGIAIIILVVIVKVILHPISKRGQLHMMKMQKASSHMKPKQEAIQQQYKNDKQKLQEEMLKLYREEGFNPAGNIFGCLPMFLQTPIWIALWTTLNTNVDMRHQPFMGWIRDLSDPDSLIPFEGTYHIPFLGAMTGPIHAFNLLPVIMAITMFLNQKLTQKLTKPKEPAKQVFDAQGKPVVDQMQQQQKIMGYMVLFMGIIFYNFPSGLNLYILSSNLLGMLEQWQIRKHLKERDARGEFDVKARPASNSGAVVRVASDGPKPKPGGLMGKLVNWAEKKSEEARLTQSRSSERTRKKQRKQSRFE